MKRMTRQRAAILKCFFGVNRPLSVEEVHASANQAIPEINLSTVYRNLKMLLEEGKINVVKLPGANVRYEVIETKHHHHFHCDACDRLFNILGCPKGLSDLVPKGFELRNHYITLSGLCNECVNTVFAVQGDCTDC